MEQTPLRRQIGAVHCPFAPEKRCDPEAGLVPDPDPDDAPTQRVPRFPGP